jgi:hypothetical protein
VARDRTRPQRGRRILKKYDIALVLKYQLNRGDCGVGETISLDSEEVTMRCETRLPLGEVVHMDIAWPLLAGGREPVVLRVQGVVVANDPQATNVTMGKYELIVGESRKLNTARESPEKVPSVREIRNLTGAGNHKAEE